MAWLDIEKSSTFWSKILSPPKRTVPEILPNPHVKMITYRGPRVTWAKLCDSGRVGMLFPIRTLQPTGSAPATPT